MPIRRARDDRLPPPARGTGALFEELPYLYCGEYLALAPLHLLSDGCLGYAFTMEVPAVDTQPDAEAAVSQVLTTLLHALAPEMQWQWFLSTHPGVDGQLSRYQVQLGQDEAGVLFTDAFVKRWRDAQLAGFFPDDPEINFFPRNQAIFVALKSAPLGLNKPHPSEFVAAALPRPWKLRLQPLLERWLCSDGARGRAERFVRGVRDVLAAAHANGWNTQAVDADALVQWVAALLFPQRRLEAPVVHGERHAGARPGAADPGHEFHDLRTAIASLGHIEDISPAGYCTVAAGQRRHHRVVSMLWQPRAIGPGMLNAVAGLRPCMNIIACAATLPPASALLQLKARALLNARSTHRFNATEMQARSDALQEVEQRIFAEGERIVEMRLQIHLVENSLQDAEEAAASVCKHLETLEISCAAEDDIGAALLLRGCLPFAVYPQTERKLRRRRRFLSRDSADLHPSGGCWTGISPLTAAPSDRPAPIVMYSNPLGEPLFIDPTKAEKNPHALVVGQSGSGKSFFVHDYLLHLWRLPDVRLFLISIKADYRKLALLLGVYVDISLDAEVSLNPFCGRPTLENQARWFAALELMLHEGNPGAVSLSREAEIALQGAAMAAAQRNWDAERDAPIRENLLEHVCLELERASGPLGRQLSQQLQPYRRGPYRRLFNAPRGVHPQDRFVFFNLGNILRQPCAALASFCVFGIIDEVMTDPLLRGVPKGLVADEVWALVRNPQAAAILERSLKAYRSLGGFAVPIVQDPQDLDSPSGRVMLVNTATKIILPMDRSGQNDLQRYVRLNERELAIVQNLRLVKRRYSEFFVSIDGMKSAKGLLIPDPLRYAIATTDPNDEERIERYFQQSRDMLSAVRRFARESPYGLSIPQEDAS